MFGSGPRAHNELLALAIFAMISDPWELLDDKLEGGASGGGGGSEEDEEEGVLSHLC